MASYQILIGDCIDQMRTLESQSVNSVVTSPPYYALRDYGKDGQIGLEPTLGEYIEKMVEVFREVHRVLRDDGTVWLNVGDSYNGTGGAGGDYNKGGLREGQPKYRGKNDTAFKRKDLMMVPHRLAIALQDDGWYVRQDIVWSKPNPMPEPVKDRCVKAHEYIFLLSKKPKYYFDYEAIQEKANTGLKISGRDAAASTEHYGVGNGGNDGLMAWKRKARQEGFKEKRNKRSVWHSPNVPWKGAHFAVFPPTLIEPCVLAGCPVGGTILDPFGGSGTTGGVAVANGRNAILIELNTEYAALIGKRIAGIVGYKLGEDESAVENRGFDDWFA